MNAIDAEHLSFEVMDGDLIIMMSDGMGASPEDNCELMELLGGEIGEDMDSFAQSIIDTALKTGEDDDATVLILRISEKKDRED